MKHTIQIHPALRRSAFISTRQDHWRIDGRWHHKIGAGDDPCRVIAGAGATRPHQVQPT